MVERSLRMREARGSIPRNSINSFISEFYKDLTYFLKYKIFK